MTTSTVRVSVKTVGAASRNFLDNLKGNSSDLVRRLGVVGYIAKGLFSPVQGCRSSSR
jgi:hypothetical protein